MSWAPRRGDGELRPPAARRGPPRVGAVAHRGPRRGPGHQKQRHETVRRRHEAAGGLPGHHHGNAGGKQPRRTVEPFPLSQPRPARIPGRLHQALRRAHRKVREQGGGGAPEKARPALPPPADQGPGAQRASPQDGDRPEGGDDPGGAGGLRGRPQGGHRKDRVGGRRTGQAVRGPRRAHEAPEGLLQPLPRPAGKGGTPLLQAGGLRRDPGGTEGGRAPLPRFQPVRGPSLHNSGVPRRARGILRLPRRLHSVPGAGAADRSFQGEKRNASSSVSGRGGRDSTSPPPTT